jgi:hypothetical protein
LQQRGAYKDYGKGGGRFQQEVLRRGWAGCGKGLDFGQIGGKRPSGAKQAAEKLIRRGTKRQGTTSVVP